MGAQIGWKALAPVPSLNSDLLYDLPRKAGSETAALWLSLVLQGPSPQTAERRIEDARHQGD